MWDIWWYFDKESINIRLIPIGFLLHINCIRIYLIPRLVLRIGFRYEILNFTAHPEWWAFGHQFAHFKHYNPNWSLRRFFCHRSQRHHNLSNCVCAVHLFMTNNSFQSISTLNVSTSALVYKNAFNLQIARDKNPTHLVDHFNEIVSFEFWGFFDEYLLSSRYRFFER